MVVGLHVINQERAGFYHVFATRGGSDYTVGMVIRRDGASEQLGSNYGNMILNRKHFNFLGQVIDKGHINATGDYA